MNTMHRRVLPLLLALAPLAATAADHAGTVIYAYGDVQAAATSGERRPLTRGSLVLAGDAVVTAQGRAQVRFTDGGAVALQPNTTFRIDDYQFDGSAAGGGQGGGRSFLNLVRGSIRFVTGAIGQTNRANYKIRTAVATIGIRGSGGRADLCAEGSCGERPDGLYLTGNQDVITLTNEAGSVDVRPGDTYFAPCLTCGINRVDVGPAAHVDLRPAQKPEEQQYVRGDERNAEGETVAVADATPAEPPVPPGPTIIPLVSGVGGGSIGGVGDTGGVAAGLLGGDLTFDSKGALTNYVDGSIRSNTFTANTVTHFGADGIVAWGLWTSGTAGGGYASGIGTSNLPALSYVVSLQGSSTPAAALAAINGTYTIFGSTPPIAVFSSTNAIGTPDSVTGSFNVNFSANTVGYDVSIPLASQTFSVRGTGSFINNSPSAGDSRFLGGGSVAITSTGAACTSGCSGQIPFGPDIQGYITGKNGERLGATYAFTSGIGTVTGSVVAKPDSALPK